ncbi:ATP-binding protein [Amycolatopsis panacis]|uniref:Helix-turn-helix domain-containing protein n=1 Tax=Amycolatopsis panacis TaxID=2340917 RepID=A0A419HXC0_9PSEU|nr:tetratricopeptide repeat protein [Amycolatopsis panacis]RJQ81700.1 helix-turn-helix domain-containing protein [Amycolatopsis panacis]
MGQEGSGGVSDREESRSAKLPARPLTAAEQFGKALRGVRVRQGMTQRELAKVAYVHHSIISRLEAGQLSPTTDHAEQLDRVLDTKGALLELATAARAEPYAGLPPPPLHFVGRARALTALTDLLIVAPNEMPNRSTVVFVAGPPGVGKTALARHWANSNADRFEQVLYADLHGYGPRPPAEPGEVLESLLRGLGVRDDRIPGTDELRLALLQGQLEKRRSVGQHVLIVLDNARDSRQVAQVLPGTPNTSVLITSRTRLSGVVIEAHAKSVRLEPMDALDAAALMASFIDEARAEAEPDAIARLVELCGALPLALNIAAERVAANDLMTVQQHADDLAERGRLELRVEDDDATEVRATFRWSYESLRPEQAQVFRLLGVHRGLHISAAAVAALVAIPVRDATRLLAELVQAHLVQQITMHRFSLHDLLRDYASEEAANPRWDNERHAAIRRLVDWYLYTANKASWAIWPNRPEHHLDLGPAPDGVTPAPITTFDQAAGWYETELPNLAGVGELALHHHLLFPAWRLALDCFDFYLHRRPWQVWIDTFEVALQAAEQAKDPERIVPAAEELAEAYLRRGNLNRAWELNSRVVAVSEQLGPTWILSFAYVGLGNIMYERGNFVEAARLCAQGLAVAKQVGSLVGETYAHTHLGRAYLELGKTDLALEHGNHAFALQGNEGTPHGRGYTGVPLARAYRHTGDLVRARRVGVESLQAYEECGDTPGKAEALGELGMIFYALGERDDGRAKVEEALDVLRPIDPRIAAHLQRQWAALRDGPSADCAAHPGLGAVDS